MMEKDIKERKHSLSKGLDLFKEDRGVLKIILEEFLDYCMGALLNKREEFEKDETLKKLYKKLNECIVLVDKL